MRAGPAVAGPTDVGAADRAAGRASIDFVPAGVRTIRARSALRPDGAAGHARPGRDAPGDVRRPGYDATSSVARSSGRGLLRGRRLGIAVASRRPSTARPKPWCLGRRPSSGWLRLRLDGGLRLGSGLGRGGLRGRRGCRGLWRGLGGLRTRLRSPVRRRLGGRRPSWSALGSGAGASSGVRSTGASSIAAGGLGRDLRDRGSGAGRRSRPRATALASATETSLRMSIRQPVSRAASRAFWPSRPIASDSIRSGTVTLAIRCSSSISTPMTWAGLSAFATNTPRRRSTG